MCLLLPALVHGATHPPVLRIVEHPPSLAEGMVGYNEEPDPGGNTSVANDTALHCKSDGSGYYANGVEMPYYKRNRDLGQTFTWEGPPARAVRLVVRTGFGNAAVRPGMYGRALSLQFFQVEGTASMHDNGTATPISASHGYPHVYPDIPSDRDDYLIGESYRSLLVLRGFAFPIAADFGIADTHGPKSDHPALRGRYLSFEWGEAGPFLEPGQRYAFLLMIDEPGADAAFTLANNYRGRYAGGHGIRREGDGAFPPPPAHPDLPPTDPANRLAAAAARLPENFHERCALPPGTNGYPDVDTHRDLQFWLVGTEGRTEPAPEATAAK